MDIKMSVLVEKTDLSLKYASHFNEVKNLLWNDSAEIINSLRNKAFQDFVLQGIPTRKNENYKYTNLQPKFFPEYKFIHRREKTDIDLKDAFRCDVPQLDTHPVFVLNGWYYKDNKSSENLPEGVILESLDTIAHQKNPLLAKYGQLAKTGEDPLVALNTAFAMDGFFLYIPKNIKVDKPIQ
ncbi:MAG: Fe-S cluster assembly protein SufD, partial [Prolixibacteraceae bacterium]|nr:Fe-S cluster assembly protein SufD [Prolixibacteraceae bacterium]